MVAARDLLTVALPAGPELFAALVRAWEGGPALLPINPRLPAAERERLIADLRPDLGVAPDVVAVVATSGTTGAARGVELTRSALEHSARASLARLGAGDARWLCCLPPSSVGGLQVLVRSLVAGTEPVMLPRFDPAAVAEADAQAVSLVPTMLARLDPAVVGRFRHVLLGGASPPPSLPANVTVTYGMTETCGGCVYDGVALDGVEVAVGDGGRIRIRGRVLARGYRGAPLPLERGWLVTNDIGRWDDRGRLEVLGRADDVIVTGGANVMPARVARAVAQHPAVAEAAVVGRPDPEWGQRVVAVVVPAGTAPDLPSLRAFLADRLAGHELPRELLVTDRIPLLPNGKPDRSKLG